MADSSDDDLPTISSDAVVTKYKMAAEITNGVLLKLVTECKDGDLVVDLCNKGDQLIEERTNLVYRSHKEIKKGIAFPTCVCINNCVCHYSPLSSDKKILIKNGDLVKIDIGCHVDGFIAVSAHTFVVGASLTNKVTGRKADVILAAYNAAEAAYRLIKPTGKSEEVTDILQKVTEEFDCKPIEGMLSHQLKQNIIDGKKCIIQNPSDAHKKEIEKAEFEVNEVYAVDVIISSSKEAKGREMDTKTTVYKRIKDTIYNLKMKASRQFLSDVDNKHGTMPFTMRSFEEGRSKIGVLECVKHELVEPFNVLYEREGEFVAQFKFTVLLMPNGPMRITGIPFESELYDSKYEVKNEELKVLLASSVGRKAKKNKKKKTLKLMKETDTNYSN